MQTYRHPALAAIIAALWLWAPVVQLRAIPLWVFAGGGSSTSSNLPAAADVLAWWDLEANGDDSSANNRDLSANGSVAYVSATPLTTGNALEVTTGGEYLSLADAAWMQPADDFTVVGWFKADDGQPISVTRCLVGQYRTSTANRSWMLGLTTSGNVTFIVSGDGASASATVNSTTTLTDGAQSWVFAAGVFTANTDVRMYINGVADATPVSAVGVTRVFDSVADLNIGTRDAQSANTLLGLFDSVAIFDRVLTGDEILALYNGGSGRLFSELP